MYLENTVVNDFKALADAHMNNHAHIKTYTVFIHLDTYTLVQILTC